MKYWIKDQMSKLRVFIATLRGEPRHYRMHAGKITLKSSVNSLRAGGTR